MELLYKLFLNTHPEKYSNLLEKYTWLVKQMEITEKINEKLETMCTLHEKTIDDMVKAVKKHCNK